MAAPCAPRSIFVPTLLGSYLDPSTPSLRDSHLFLPLDVAEFVALFMRTEVATC